MKKILVAVMAAMMTMGLMAQCPHQKPGCSTEKTEGCQVRKECVKYEPVYSPETRAMMHLDRIARIVKDLTGAEREQLLAFYKAHYIKCDKLKETANPMSREECRKECDAELRKVIGDDRYIQYLESTRLKGPNCEMRRAPQGGKCCHRGGSQHGCPRK